jgi:hypothetical protein
VEDIDERMNQLEESIDLGQLSVADGYNDQLASPRSRGKLQVNNFQRSRRPKSAPVAVGAAIQATFDRLNTHESDIDELKKRLHLGSGGQDDELKIMRRKLRSVVETTSSACRTVSNSVGDVQDATVQIFTWAERVHAAMGVLSDKVGVRPNVCPRLQIVPGLAPTPRVSTHLDNGVYSSPSRHSSPSHHHHHHESHTGHHHSSGHGSHHHHHQHSSHHRSHSDNDREHY